jgi:two-component system, NtrC family, response regulator AtoC
MKRLLLTWSDRGVEGRRPSHHGVRPADDTGPVVRLLSQEESAGRYQAVWLVATPPGRAPAEKLAAEVRGLGPAAELKVLEVKDPSDYAALFKALGPLVAEVGAGGAGVDVLLSAGTPQAQTLWVILVQAGLLKARMLQVIPAAFVPDPHPKAIREVRLDIEGFPEIRALRDEVRRLRAEVRARAGRLIGGSAPMRELIARLSRVAAAEVPVLIAGETGAGKELVARELHLGSPRAKGPFVAENCGAFEEGVLISELFGHEPGAFTGATGRRRGLFEQASGGTLFLDEVGELSPRVQAALLRVLQEGTLRRLGAERALSVDVRVVAATHRDLRAMVSAGRFREDLYYRLRGATLEVPPLRARPGDIDLLIEAFLEEARPERRVKVSPEARELLRRYPWPGNVRELRAEVMRWAVFCDERVEPRDLSPEIRGAEPPAAPEAPGEPRAETLGEAVAAAERRAISGALAAHSDNLSRAARALEIDRNTLKRKMTLYGLWPEGRGPAGDDAD